MFHRMIIARDYIVVEKLRFENVFCPHENEKPAFLNSFGLRSVFKKLLFRDRLVSTVGLTVEIKLRFQIPPAQCGRTLSGTLFLSIQVVQTPLDSCALFNSPSPIVNSPYYRYCF